MTTLAANTPRVFELGDENHIPAVAADIIYEGAAVGDNASGYGRPLVAGDPFRGFALEKCDNAAGSAGDKNIKVRRFGDVQLTISSIAITDVGKDVYASDDNTFTLTKGSNTRIGYVKRYVTANTCVVAFEENKGSVAELGGTLTGTVTGTMADVAAAAGACAGGSTPTATQVDTAIATAVADLVTSTNLALKELQTQVNALLRSQGG